MCSVCVRLPDFSDNQQSVVRKESVFVQFSSEDIAEFEQRTYRFLYVFPCILFRSVAGVHLGLAFGVFFDNV